MATEAAAYPLNIVRSVTIRGGWIGLFSGESRAKAMERIITQLNADGYRVAEIIPDEWSFFTRMLALLIFVVTLGIVGFREGVLIVGERVDQSAARQG